MRLFSGIAEMIAAIWGPDAVPYTPPAWKQIATLPDEDILVRGSDPPSAASDELLRAAREGVETDAEELVRAGQGTEIPHQRAGGVQA